jgi:seryl-tRNA synthetase
MLDIKFIRENAEGLEKAIKDKNIDLDINKLLEIDEKRVKAIQYVEELKAEKNKLNELMKMAKDEAERKEIIGQGTAVKEKLAIAEPEYDGVRKEFDEMMVKVPVIPSADTPVGKDDSGNVEVYKRGEISTFDFKPKTHIELADNLGIIDFERGSKVAGYRGYYLKNEGTLLVMALMMYALKKMVAKGYNPMIPPTDRKNVV